MGNQMSRKDYIMSANSKRMLLTSPDFLSALDNFLRAFEAVFGDADWEMTRDILACDGLDWYIHPNGTFLEPGVADEDANWHNRGALLHYYRDLKAALDQRHFNVVDVHPCGTVTKPSRQSASELADDYI